MFQFNEVETYCKDVLGAKQRHLALPFVCFCLFPLATVKSNDYNQGDTYSCEKKNTRIWGGVNDCLQAWQANSVCLSMFAFMYRCEASQTNKRTGNIPDGWPDCFCANFPGELFEHKYQPWQNSPGLQQGLPNQPLRRTTYSLLPRTGVHPSVTVAQLRRRRSLWPPIPFIPWSIDKVGDCWQTAVTYELIVIQYKSLLKPTAQMEGPLLDLIYVSVSEGVWKSRAS